MRRLPLFLFLLTLVVGIVSAQAQSRAERDVRALLDRAIAAANSTDEKLDQQNLADHSRAGGPFFNLSSHPTSVTELEAMARQNQGLMATRKYSASAPITLRVDKNVAWAAFPFHFEGTLRDGTRLKLDGRATMTFGREGKAWKITHWHSSLPAPPPLTASARDAEAQKLIEIERNAWEAIRAKQPAAFADYFAEEASFLSEGSAYRMSGKANLMRALTSLIESTELRSYQILEPRVELLGDTALLTYYFTESGVYGGKEFSTAGKVSMVFVKQGGVWRALHEHRSVNR